MLSIDWWSEWRTIDLISESLRASFAEYCYGVVQYEIDENEQAQPRKYPSSWKQITTALRHSDETSTSRIRRGLRPTHVEELLGLAALLDVAPAVLPPPIFQWLEVAVMEICEEKNVELRGIDVSAFVDYSIHLFRRQLAQQKSRSYKIEHWGISEECLTSAHQKHAEHFRDERELQAILEKIAKVIQTAEVES